MAKLLQTLSVPHTTKNLRRQLLTHPDYPSLQGITGVLDEYRISNVAFRATIEQLRQVEYPVLLYMKERNGTFGLLHDIDQQQAILSTETYERKSYPLHQFQEIWSGIAVLAEPNEQSGEPTASEKSSTSINRIAYWAVAAGLLLLLAAAGWQSQSIPFASLLVVKLIGISLVALLAAHELGIDSSLTDKLCTLTKSTGCNEVLTSKASALFGVLKLADIGIVYFFSTTIALVLSAIVGMFADMLLLLAWLSVLTLPFILFSVTYQLAVVKKWCPFCMGVAATLTVETVLAAATGSIRFSIPTLPSVGLAAFGVLSVSLLWIAIKPVLKEKMRLERFEFLYTRLKRKPEVIKGILAESDYTEIPTLEGEIVLGNPNAPFTITEVVAPYCSPCARSFDKLNELLKEAGNSVKVQFRFLVKSNREDKSTKVAAHMFALADKLSPEELRCAFEAWFKERDYEKWIKAYAANVDEHIYLRLETQQEWAKGLGINATPTIYVNGYSWKLDMDLYDLKYSL